MLLHPVGITNPPGFHAAKDPPNILVHLTTLARQATLGAAARPLVVYKPLSEIKFLLLSARSSLLAPHPKTFISMYVRCLYPCGTPNCKVAEDLIKT